MKATILHDEHGKILAISRPVDLKKAGSKFLQAGMIPGRGQRALEIELGGKLGGITLTELHKQYRVDVAASKLVKKTAPH